MKFTAFAISMLGAALMPLSVAGAAQISYVFTGTATGSISGKSFSDVSFTVTAVANPANIPAPTAGEIMFTPSTVTITDSAAHSLAIANSYLFDDQSSAKIGFGVGNDDIQFVDSSFATYNMKTSTGPFTEASDPSIADWVNMPTSEGSLTVTDLTNLSFTATLSPSSGGSGPTAVPLPSAAGMSLAGLSLCAIAAYRRSVAARARQA